MPRRIRNVLYAFALAAQKDELERASVSSGLAAGGVAAAPQGTGPPPRPRMPQE